MATGKRNPFPSSGVTRPGLEVETLVSLPSQGGAVERLEELVRSVITHGTQPVKDEFDVEIMKSKPELVMLRGEFGSGKTLTLTRLYMDCKQGRIKIKTKEGKTERKAIVIPIYQPLHALLSNPEDLLDVLQQRLPTETKNEQIREAILKAKEKAEQTVVERDSLLRRIYVCRYSVDAAVRNAADAIVIILDELEESVDDYARFVESYAKIFSILREFTDRQVGPVITVLGITPRAIDSLVEETKQALLRRAVTIDLPHLTSPDELFALAKGYDYQVEKYVDSDTFDLIYGLTRGNPGFALASLHWAWEEMQYRNLDRVDAKLAKEAVESIAWKGERLIPTAAFEAEARYPSARRVLETVKREVAIEIDPESVLEGVMASIDSIALIKTPEETCNMLEKEFGERGTRLKAVSLLNASLYSEPHIEYSILLAFGDNEHADERNITDVLEVWSGLHGDFIIFVMPSTANELRRAIDKICTGKMYRGLEWRELVIPLLLGNEDMRELTSLATMSGTEIKNAEKLVAQKYGIAAKIEDLIRKLKETGKSIPYRWELKRLTKEVQWGIYALIAKRFTDKEFTAKEAIDFVLSHYDLVEETKAHYKEARLQEKYSDSEEFKEKVNRDVVGVLDVLVDNGFANRRTDKYYIPPLLTYERELYTLVKTIRENEKGRNPGTDDLKYEFFGYAPKANNIYGLAKGMEGKGYIKCIQEGPLQRRFYKELHPSTHLAETEITLKRVEKGIQESVAERLRENKIVLKEPEFKRFMKSVTGRIEDRIREAYGLLEKAGDETLDQFERLRLMNWAEILTLIATDYAKELVDRWLDIKTEIAQTQADIERFLKITEHSEETNRLDKTKATEIRGTITEAETSLRKVTQATDAFELEDAEAKLRDLRTMVRQIEQRLMAELEEIGKAEKSIRIAEEGVQRIATLIERNKHYAEILELNKKLEEFSMKISDARKAAEKGKTADVSVEPLPVFLRQATSDKIAFVESHMAALKRAEDLLNALGQSPAADQVATGLPIIDKSLKRAVREEDLRDHDAFVENLGKAYEEVLNQMRVFDRLRILFMGAVREGRSKFKSHGVDKAISQVLPLSEAKARELRHLLEELDLVKCTDIEVVHG